MSSFTHSPPVSPHSSRAPTQNSLWVPPPCSPRGYDNCDNWWMCDSTAFYPVPFDENPKNSGFTNGFEGEERFIVRNSYRDSLGLECSEDYLYSDDTNRDSISHFGEWCQPEFMPALPIGSTTDLDFVNQSWFSNKSPTLTTKDFELCVDDESSDSELSGTNPCWTIIDLDPQHEPISHGILGDETEIRCHECNSTFKNKTSLDLHAKQSLHTPLFCRCFKKFSREDCLARHVRRFNPTALFPCPYCEKHDGKRAFTRRDHLTQHLRGRHRIERGALNSLQSSRERGWAPQK